MTNRTMAPISTQSIEIPGFLYPLHVGGVVELETQGMTGKVESIEILPDQSVRFVFEGYDGEPAANYSTDEIVAVFA